MAGFEDAQRPYGHLDLVKDGCVGGWCWNPAAPDATVSVAVSVDDRVVGHVDAGLYRDDLERAGIGDGRHAFLFDLTPFLGEGGLCKVGVRADGVELVGSPSAYFLPPSAKALQAAHPSIPATVTEGPAAMNDEPDYVGPCTVLSVLRERGGPGRETVVEEGIGALDEAVCTFPSGMVAAGEYCRVKAVLRGRSGYHAEIAFDFRALAAGHNICGFAFVEIRMDGEAVYRKDLALCRNARLSFFVGGKEGGKEGDQEEVRVELLLVARRDSGGWLWDCAQGYSIGNVQFHGYRASMPRQDRSSDRMDGSLGLLRPSAGPQAADRLTVIFPTPSVPWQYMRQRPQQLALAFAERGHTVVYLGKQDQGASSPAVQLLRKNLFLIRDDLFLFDHPLRLFDLEDRRYVIVQYWPHQHDCVQRIKAMLPAALVYDCVDDHKVFAQYDKLERDHRHALDTADVVFATAARLLGRIRQDRADAAILPNGVRLEDYAGKGEPIRDEEVAEMRRKHPIIIGYYGALAEWIDWRLIRTIALHRPHWTIWLTGIVYDTIIETERLRDFPNIVIWPHQPYERLLEIVKAYDVALVPFRLNDLTHSVSPVKLFEYAAAGRHVVSTAIEEVVASGLAKVGRDPKEIIDLIETQLLESFEASALPSYPALDEHTWTARVATIENSLRAVLPDGGRAGRSPAALGGAPAGLDGDLQAPPAAHRRALAAPTTPSRS